MKLKLQKLSLVQLNVISYILLGFLFLHVVTCLAHDLSAFNVQHLYQNIIRFKFLCLVEFLTIFLVLKIKSYSRYFLILISSIVVLECSFLLLQESNKLILFLLFSYVVISYYFYQIWDEELREPYYNPNYSTKNLFSPMLYEIKTNLSFGDKQYKATLTNWNQNSAFVFFEDSEVASIAKDTGLLSIEFKGALFSQKVRLISKSSTLNGIGVKFEVRDEENELKWSDLISIYNDLGFSPRYLT